MYGSSFRMETRRPRALRMRPMLAAVMPLPREEVTPPVTKTYFAMGRVLRGFFQCYPLGHAPSNRGDEANARGPGYRAARGSRRASPRFGVRRGSVSGPRFQGSGPAALDRHRACPARRQQEPRLGQYSPVLPPERPRSPLAGGRRVRSRRVDRRWIAARASPTSLLGSATARSIYDLDQGAEAPSRGPGDEPL